jgi:hypothetical protein
MNLSQRPLQDIMESERKIEVGKALQRLTSREQSVGDLSMHDAASIASNVDFSANRLFNNACFPPPTGIGDAIWTMWRTTQGESSGISFARCSIVFIFLN